MVQAGPPLSQAPPATQSAPSWVSSILAGIGAPVTQNNVNKLAAWNACEGNASGGSGLPINNPFNTTLAFGGGTSVNSAGVKHYPDISTGISATVQTLQGTAYKRIVTNLQQDGSGSAFAGAVGSSPWGTSGTCIGKTLGVAPAAGGNSSTGSGSGSNVGCHAKDNGSNCAINFPGSFCITYCELKALKAGLVMAAGAAFFTVGALVLVAYGFSRTGAGKAAAQAYNATPARKALKTVGARRAASQSLRQTQARENIRTEGAVTRREASASARRYSQTRPTSTDGPGRRTDPGRVRSHRGRKVNERGEEMLA